MSEKMVVLGFGFVILGLHVISANAIVKGDSYTAHELQILPKLLKNLQNDLPQRYMFENKFLIRFLRARKLDLNAAETMIRKCLKWRKEHNIESLLDEDFSVWETKYYSFHFTTDREGRPTLVTGLQGNDFRKFLLSGKGPEVARYIYYGFEKGLVNLQRVHNVTGVEYTSGHLLFNMGGYTARSYACLGCIPYWIDLARVYEACYPQYGKKLLVVNTPRIFQSLLNVVNPLLDPATADSFILYGYDKAEWTRELLKIFPVENITPEFGGRLKIPNLKNNLVSRSA